MYVPPEWLQPRNAAKYDHGDGGGGLGVRVAGGRVRVGVASGVADAGTSVGVCVGVEVGVSVAVGVGVKVGVFVGVGVQVGGSAAMTSVVVGSEGLRGLSATCGLTKINVIPMHTRTIRTTTTSVAI